MLALLISASGLETLRFSAPAIIAFRLIVFAVFALLGVYAVVRPLRGAPRALTAAFWIALGDT